MERNSKLKPRSENFTASLNYSFTPTEPYCPDAQACEGHEFYGGVVSVRDFAFIEHNRTILAARDPIFNDVNPGNITGHLYRKLVAKNWGCEAFAGYGYTFSCGAYLGLEAFYTNSTSSSKINTSSIIPLGVTSPLAGITTTGTTLLKLGEGYGITIIPGYKFSEDILF